MDRRSKKKIKISMLLSLFFLGICGTVFYIAGQAQYRQSLMRAAEQAQKHPGTEQELASFWRTGDGDSEISEQRIEEIHTRYGYQFWNTAQGKLLGFAVGSIGFVGFIFIWGGCIAAIWGEKKRALTQREPEEIREILKEKEAYISDLKESSRIEEENTKALITNISHQLKTPIAGIRVIQEMYSEEDADENELREYFQRSRESVEKLSELTEEMMKLSRLENHMIRICPENGDIKATIIGAVEEMIMKAVQKKIEIHTELEQGVICAHDNRWTREAFVNILDNAVKYSQEGSNIHIRLKKMISYALVEFEDEGIGVPKEEYHKIFDRFYRGKMQDVQKREGAGVGLYLARKIVEEQGGTISVKAAPGKGSIFRVTLPLTK